MGNDRGSERETEVTSATDLIESLWKPAIAANIAPSAFWKMTIGEIIDVIEVRNKSIIEQQKEDYKKLFHLAEIVAVEIWHDGKTDRPLIWDLMPEMFKEEKEAAEQAEAEREREIYMERFRAMAERLNARQNGVENVTDT